MTESTFVERLGSEIGELKDQYNVPRFFADSFKEDLKDAFAVKGAYRPGYEPGAVLSVGFNPLELVSDPLGTAKKFGQAITDVSSLGDILPTIKPAQLAGLTRAEGDLWEYLCTEAEWRGYVPSSLRNAFSLWGASTGKQSSRLVKEELLRGNPGLALMMARALKRSGVSEVAGASLDRLIADAHRVEAEEAIAYTREDGAETVVAGIAGCLEAADRAKELGRWKEADFFWSKANELHKAWGGRWASDKGGKVNYQEKLIKGFERQLRLNPALADSPEGQVWRYWHLRNYRYQVLNFLRTWRKDGLKGVASQYAWKKLTLKLFKKGTWRYYLYLPNVVTEIQKRALGKLLQRQLTKLTAVRTAIRRALRKYIGAPLKKAAAWAIKKLGLKALGAKLGALIGTAGTPVGSAAGAVIGAVGGFLLEVVIDKFGGILKAALVVVLGGLVSLFAFLATGAIVAVMAISLIFNTNAVFPTDVGGANPLFTSYSTLVRATKEACEPAPSCTNFSFPLRIAKDGADHEIRWRIAFTNKSAEAQSIRFSDDRCQTGDELFSLDPGASQDYFCNQTISANNDEVITNAVSGSVLDDGAPVSAMGVVLVGDPGVVFPTGWPTLTGCVTQGPGGAFSHIELQAIDIAAAEGTAVFATHDGTVTQVVNYYGPGVKDDSYGNRVMIRSEAGFTSLYTHLLDVNVSEGDSVTYGQLIGWIDNNGYSTGNHLHYEFRGLNMAPPYIPVSVGACGGEGQPNCGFCL
jgi:hypothetical protein